MPVCRRGAFKVASSLVLVQSKVKHGLPVHLVTGFGHGVVLLPGVGDALGDVGGVGGDAAGDDSLLHVVQVRQAKMLCRRHIAQEVRTVCRCNGSADGGGDVIIAGGNVGDNGTQYIERGVVAKPLLQLHVGRNLIHGHVTRPFHHDLHVLCPGALREAAKLNQLGNLPCVGAVVDAAGA